MKYIDIDTFDKKARNGGVWTLHDANEADRILRQALEPGVEVEKLLIPVKYIKEGEYLIIVQASTERAVQMMKCHKRYVDVFPDRRTGGIKIYVDRDKIEPVVESYDFVDERDKTDEEIIEDMIATGYITREEWDKYTNPENCKELPLIKLDISSYSGQSDNMVSISEANQNFSKVAKLVDEEKEIVVMKHNKPKYVILEYDKYIEYMKQLNENRK
jgi:prevent-host-death family protein